MIYNKMNIFTFCLPKQNTPKKHPNFTVIIIAVVIVAFSSRVHCFDTVEGECYPLEFSHSNHIERRAHSRKKAAKKTKTI